MMAPHKSRQPLTRRDALCRMGNGFGMLAFASLVSESIVRAAGSLAQDGSVDPRRLDHPARAKRVIFLFMNGGLSQVDSFDPKPMLDKYHGQPLPGGTVATERKTGALMRSPFTFKKYGKSGIEVSELFPHVGECADDICFIRSMYTDIPNHEPSMLMMNTGHTQVGRPSIGSWLTYGLGTDNKNLPGYVVLCPDVPTTVGPPLWNSAFLPAVHQGTFIADKVEKQTDTALIGKDFDPEDAHLLHSQRQVHAHRAASRARSARDAQSHAAAIASRCTIPSSRRRISSMETAYRMQTEAPDVFDIRKESEATLKLYGAGSTARSCLMAVRLIERGVRMAQVYYAKGDPWDAHADIQAHRKNAKDSDQPFAAVIKDLKSRGLFKDTLVVCGSEFGRTPVMEVGGGAGRRRTAAITTRSASRCGWPAAASRAGRSTAPPTTSGSRRSRSRSTSTTCTRRSCTCWASITRS